MRNIQLSCFLVAVCLLTLATGCSSNKGKIEGTKWTCQAGTIEGQPIPAGMMKLEFSTDGKLVFDTTVTKFTGTYSLGFGEYVTLNFDGESHMETIKISDGVLEMIDSDGTSLKFNKVE